MGLFLVYEQIINYYIKYRAMINKGIDKIGDNSSYCITKYESSKNNLLAVT